LALRALLRGLRPKARRKGAAEIFRALVAIAERAKAA
jgi:hypothetical protein